MLLRFLYSQNPHRFRDSTCSDVARSFVFKIRKELQVSSKNVIFGGQTKELFLEVRHCQGYRVSSASPGYQGWELRKINESKIRRVVHEDIRWKSYGMRKGQLMSTSTREDSLIHSDRLLNKVKNFHAYVTRNIWLINTLDWNSVGYYIWVVVERGTKNHAHKHQGVDVCCCRGRHCQHEQEI